MDYNLYINSKENKHTLYLNNHITCGKNQSIKVSVMNFYILNSMYNITEDNNSFDVEMVKITDVDDITVSTKNLPIGNYSVLTFLNALKSSLYGIIDIQYNIPNNTYTFTKTNNLYYITIKNIKCMKQLGLYQDTEITTQGVNGSFVNMVDYSQIIVKSNLNYKDLNQDNIFTDGLSISQILLFTSRQDIEPFKCITYDGDAFAYNLLNTDINNITFNIVNERNELVKNCGEWFLHLKFEIVDIKEELSSQLLKMLNDIKYLLLNIFFSYIRKK